VARILASAWDVAVSGTYAYVIGCDTTDCGLRVIDVSNPANPSIAAATNIYGALAVAVSW
jgi:hypothetical protein